MHAYTYAHTHAHKHTHTHTHTHMLVLSRSSVETLDFVAMRVPGSTSPVSNSNGLLVTAECQVNAADRYEANNNALEPCGVTPQDACVCTHAHAHVHPYMHICTHVQVCTVSHTLMLVHAYARLPLYNKNNG